MAVVEPDEEGTDLARLQRRDGRLFTLQLERSQAARGEAEASVRELPGGLWQARIGGRLRGATQRFVSRQAALEAIRAHYNAALFARLQARRLARRRAS
jgi:hypothetical protein